MAASSTTTIGTPAGGDEIRDRMNEQTRAVGPTFFRLRAQLPAQGRTNIPIATSDRMYVWLKTYASGGENELHAHPNEDHAFFVLQGAAEFYGPNGETHVVGAREGVFLPRGTFYWFKTVSAEPLVMIRVGAIVDPQKDLLERINIEGRPMLGNSKENKEVQLVLSDRWFE